MPRKPGASPLAIYHLSVKPISRSAGRSATASAAYRAGDRVLDERTGIMHDYSRKRGIEHTEIFLPENSPAWASNRAALWNAAELAETRKNSTVAREFELALPAELNQDQRRELVREFAGELVKRHGMAVDVSIHEPGRQGDNRNHHAHVLCSTRRLTPEGFKDKTRELDNQRSGEVEHWRGRWEQVTNRHLENAGHQARVDHRGLEAQRAAAIERGDVEQAAQLDRAPTVHLGPNVVEMERRGIRTDRGDRNREAQQGNAQVIDLAEVRKRIEAERVADRAGLPDRPGVARIGQSPPPESRNRLREMSELGAVKLRPLVQDRDAADALTRPAKEPHPEKIKAEWKAENVRQFALVATKAQRAEKVATGQLERQEKKLEQHALAEPRAPAGLFAAFKQTTHEQAARVWRGVRDGLQKRFNQLRNRLHVIGDYLRKAGPNELPTRGERLAEQKAAQAQPELAANFQRVMEKEKAATLAAYRTKIEQRRQAKKEHRAMKMETIEELKKRNDANRINADKKEIAKLEKAGREAEALGEDIERGTKEQQKATAAKQELKAEDKELSKDARKRELLEKFKEKMRTDRENDRSRGR